MRDVYKRQTLGWRANVGYSNRFGKHDVAAMLAYHYYQDEVKGDAQDVKNTNTTLRLNYGCLLYTSIKKEGMIRGILIVMAHSGG